MGSNVFAKGINFMGNKINILWFLNKNKCVGQLGIKNGRKNIDKFTEIPSLKGHSIKQIEAHFSQSFCLMS